MNEQEYKMMQDTVKTGVAEGVEPIWRKMSAHDEKLADHTTEIALHAQGLDQSLTSQVAQGERIGDAEDEILKFGRDYKWIAVIATAVAVDDIKTRRSSNLLASIGYLFTIVSTPNAPTPKLS